MPIKKEIRINKFFKFHDAHNNDRIFMEIINNNKLLEPLRELISTIIYIIVFLIIAKLLIMIKNILNDI